MGLSSLVSVTELQLEEMSQTIIFPSTNATKKSSLKQIFPDQPKLRLSDLNLLLEMFFLIRRAMRYCRLMEELGRIFSSSDSDESLCNLSAILSISELISNLSLQILFLQMESVLY